MTADPGRAILHVDMDAFFAAVEQRDNPEYRGRPVIVGADPKEGRGRGVVAACSYEARAVGVHSALPISQAWRRCPGGVYLRPRLARYAEVSARVFAILERYTDLVEPLSIDEAFLDVTGSGRLFGDPEAIGRGIKAAIRGELGLVASVGVAPTKFAAKVASDLGKPDGFVVVPPGGVAAFLAPLPTGRLWGAGPETVARLARLGIRTMGELAGRRPADLVASLGPGAEGLWHLAQGRDERPVEVDRGAKSVGAETTFEADVDDPGEVRLALLGLAERVARRLRRLGLRAGGVTLKFRYDSFETVTRSTALGTATDLAEDLHRALLELLGRVPWAGRRVRLVGVAAERLQPRGARRQTALFGAEERERRERLARAADAVRAKHGADVLTRGALLGKGKPES